MTGTAAFRLNSWDANATLKKDTIVYPNIQTIHAKRLTKIAAGKF